MTLKSHDICHIPTKLYTQTILGCLDNRAWGVSEYKFRISKIFCLSINIELIFY